MGIAVRLAVFVGLAGVLWAVIEVWLPPKSLWVSASKWTVGVVVGLIVIFSVGRRFAGWANARMELTDQRIRIRYRLRKAGWDIPLLSIVEVTYVSGPIQRLFGVGSCGCKPVSRRYRRSCSTLRTSSNCITTSWCCAIRRGIGMFVATTRPDPPASFALPHD